MSENAQPDFIQIGPTLINTRRLVLIGPSPKVPEDCYLAVWDTGQELMLSRTHGEAIAEIVQPLRVSPSEGNTAISSESAT